MDFRFFQKLFEHAAFDEVKEIGKDIVIEGHSGHIVGMTRKEKQVRHRGCFRQKSPIRVVRLLCL